MFDRKAGRAEAQGSLGERVTIPSFVRPGRRLALVLACGLLVAGLSGCQRQQANAGAANQASSTPPAALPSLLLAPEDLVTLRSSASPPARPSPAPSSPSARPTCAPRSRQW